VSSLDNNNHDPVITKIYAYNDRIIRVIKSRVHLVENVVSRKRTKKEKRERGGEREKKRNFVH